MAMNVLITRAFSEKAPRRNQYNISYRSISIDKNDTIRPEGCSSIRFKNQGTSNVKILGDEILRPGESTSFANFPNCKIQSEFLVQEA